MKLLCLLGMAVAMTCSQTVIAHTGYKKDCLYNSLTKNCSAEKLPADSTSWLKHLADFRTAVLHADKKAVHAFFHFPVTSNDNNVWRLVYDGKQKMLEQLPDEPKPFLEKDLDAQFTSFFPAIFSNALQHLNLDRLSKKAEAETASFRKNSTTTYKMYATVDTTEKTLTLSMGFHTLVKDKKGKIEDNEEYGTQYVFTILPDGNLVFNRIGFSA